MVLAALGWARVRSAELSPAGLVLVAFDSAGINSVGLGSLWNSKSIARVNDHRLCSCETGSARLSCNLLGADGLIFLHYACSISSTGRLGRVESHMAAIIRLGSAGLSSVSFGWVGIGLAGKCTCLDRDWLQLAGLS